MFQQTKLKGGENNMTNQFKVTIELNAKEEISIAEIQRAFRQFCFGNEKFTSASIKTEVKKEEK